MTLVSEGSNFERGNAAIELGHGQGAAFESSWLRLAAHPGPAKVGMKKRNKKKYGMKERGIERY